MKRLGKSIILAGCLAAVFSGCDRLDLSEGVTQNRLINDFQLGYTAKASKLAKMLGISADQYTTFNSEEAYKMLEQSGTLEEDVVLRNKFEYVDEEVFFEIKTNPEKRVTVKDVIATSSDTTVIKILGTTTEGVRALVKDLGDADIYVQVVGGKNTVEHNFPLRVVGTIDLRFRITPFWLRKVATKIRMNTRKLPAGVKDMVMWSKDSVTVIGYCEFYDFAKYGKNTLVMRDTTTYPTKEFLCHYKKYKYYMLRNITDAIRKYSDRTVEGTRIVETTYNTNEGTVATRYDTVKYDYPFIPEQVILTYVAICDNPFIEFLATVRCKKTFDVYEEGKEPADWSEESDDIGDGPVDDPSEEDDDEETEEDKITQNYFKVQLNDFLTEHQRDSLRQRVTDLKKKYNYDENLSEDEKDKAMERINEHLDD